MLLLQGRPAEPFLGVAICSFVTRDLGQKSVGLGYPPFGPFVIVETCIKFGCNLWERHRRIPGEHELYFAHTNKVGR